MCFYSSKYRVTIVMRARMTQKRGFKFQNQNGFRPGRSTSSHILSLRRILEGATAKNLPAVMTFIDFRKAFDSVHRGILMKILRAYGHHVDRLDILGTPG